MKLNGPLINLYKYEYATDLGFMDFDQDTALFSTCATDNSFFKHHMKKLNLQ
jgi:hypothetical protein